MKKYLLLLLAFMPILVFNSCSSDNNDDESKRNVLLGTKWQAEDRLYESFWGGGKTYAVLDFNSDTTCELYDTQNGNVVYDCGKYNYSISGNTVTFKNLKDGDISTYVINGRTMDKKTGRNIYSTLTSFIRQ